MKNRERVTPEVLADTQMVDRVVAHLAAGHPVESVQVVDEDGRLYLEVTTQDPVVSPDPTTI